MPLVRYHCTDLLHIYKIEFSFVCAATVLTMNTLDLKVEAAPEVFLVCLLRAIEMAQLGKGLANNPDGLSLIP